MSRKHLNNKITIHIVLFTLFFTILSLSSRFAAYAAEDGEYAYLYFYTIDGEEIEDLEKRLRIKSDGLSKEYEFKDPNDYRYLPQEGADGELIYSEFYDQVQGIYWEEESDDGDLGQYEINDVARFKAGDHFFRVKSDNPALTGENLIDTPSSEHAYLYFYSADYDNIEDLTKELTKEDEYTMPDPSDYVHWGEYENTSGLNGSGIYWACTDQDDKRYLFEAGDKCKFKPGDYEFHVVTDDPVTVRFCYPMDVPTYFVIDKTPGELYAEAEVIPGETIRLKRSLGAILWGCDFVGWEEYNFEYNDDLFSGGESYRIMDNVDLTFYAVYEENDDWDPSAVDENTGYKPEESEDELIVDIDAVNEAAGAGYGAYIDSSGKLNRIGGTSQINSNTILKGIQGTIKDKKWLTSLKDSEADPNDPENYTHDKYGRKFEDSNLEKEINNVLKQDNSSMYMDVYGNAFVYYSSLSREDNMSIALARLQAGKTDSWVNNVQNWDSEMINRFEAIEFALLKGEYPEDGEDLFAGLDPEVVNGEQLIWKDSYMSESAFKKLLPYKKIWKGWYDTYDDGLYEKYKGTTGGGIIQISKSALKNISSMFSITAYADKNDMGEASQVDARISASMDLYDTFIAPQYYDPTKSYSLSSYGFSGLDLSSDQIQILQQIFEALVDYGFSEQAAAGACGNIWQECHFDPTLSGGLIQWQDSRFEGLKKLAESMGTTWQDTDAQIAFMLKELDSGYLNSANKYLQRYTKYSSMSSVDDVTVACDAWCYAIEGCVCFSSTGTQYCKAHGAECGLLANGQSFQHINLRRKFSLQIYNAMTATGGILGGSFAGMTNGDIIGALFPGCSSMKDVSAKYSESQIRKMQVSFKLNNGKTVTSHKAVAADLQAALNEILESGFSLQSVGCFVWRTNTSDSSSLSFHALGLAVDINPSSNPQFYISERNEAWIKANYRPGADPYAITLKQYSILKSYGFLWGRDFSSRPDLMHFVIGEVGQDGRNTWISTLCE